MKIPLVRVALFASMVFSAVPAFGDDNGKKLNPSEMLEAIDPAMRMRVVDLLKRGEIEIATEDVTDLTVLNAEEAGFVVSMLDFEWKMLAVLNERADLILTNLDPAKREEITTLLSERKHELALEELLAETDFDADELTPVITVLERRLLAAGKIKMIAEDTRADEVMASLSPAKRTEVMEFIAAGRKIAAIRVVRAETRLGLKGAKDVVDALMRR